MFERFARLVALAVVGLVLGLPTATPIHAAGRPILTLPTPPGETWKVIQGYNCGSHNGWGRMSFDLVNTNGRTRGAPISAAADGTMWWQGGNAGALILDHGNGYYTMYSHLQTRINVPRGTAIARGEQIGTAGAVNPTPTTPHLHFTLFKGEGAWAEDRYPLPLSFAEGYDFPDQKKCSAHQGATLTASGGKVASGNDASGPAIAWANAAPQTWLSAGRVDWAISDDRKVRGFSQRWDAEPTADAPQFENASAGFLELTEPGKHTVYVRAWDAAGNQTLASRELWYDPSAPLPPPVKQRIGTLSSAQSVTLSWTAAQDAVSGIKGYQLYVGPDPAGTSEWFVATPEVGVGQLGAGRQYLRARAQDLAGNFSDWVTVEVLEVE